MGRYIFKVSGENVSIDDIEVFISAAPWTSQNDLSYFSSTFHFKHRQRFKWQNSSSRGFITVSQGLSVSAF